EKTPTSELASQNLSLSDELAINNLEKSVPYKTAESKNSDITKSEKTPTSELENQSLALSDELVINNLEKSVPYKTANAKDSDRKDRIDNKDRVDSKDLDDNELDSKDQDNKYQDRKVHEKRNHKRRDLESRNLTKMNNQIKSQNPRYISKKLKYHIWQRDSGKCTKCGSRQHLNVDHVKPVALGGEANSENLRLLCQPCNQRQAIRIFGLNLVESQIKKERMKERKNEGMKV
ncbi:MAG: HNH endonuclease, partial [Bdellovibrionales bacterium]|nr:HNH endonuclease [Bdellovibrionales bacterium]